MKVVYFSGVNHIGIRSFRRYFHGKGWEVVSFFEELSHSTTVSDEYGRILGNALGSKSWMNRQSSRARELWAALVKQPITVCKGFSLLGLGPFGSRASFFQFLWYLRELDDERVSSNVVLQSFDGAVARRVEVLRRIGVLAGTKHVVSFQGLDLTAYSSVAAAERYQLVFEGANAVIVQSRFMYELAKRAGCPPEKLSLIPYPIDLKEIERRDSVLVPQAGERIRLISVGRLIELKGHEYAIRAVRKLRESGIDVGLTIVGSGPLQNELQKLCEEEGLEDVVKLTGNLPYSDVMRLMGDSHIFLYTGITVGEHAAEALGFVMMEAQLVGLPSVVTNVGGVAEAVVPGESAIVIPERDVSAICDAVIALCSDLSSWETRVRVGEKYVLDTFSIDVVGDAYRKVYERFT